MQAAPPLPDDEMEALFDMLDEMLSEEGCEHSRRLTDAWLAERGHPVEPMRRGLDGTGGFCNCEVLANWEPAWREATGND